MMFFALPPAFFSIITPIAAISIPQKEIDTSLFRKRTFIPGNVPSPPKMIGRFFEAQLIGEVGVFDVSKSKSK